MDFMLRDGCAIRYQEAGTGEPVLLVHGTAARLWVQAEPVVDAMTAVARSMAALHRCRDCPPGINLVAWLDEQQASALRALPAGLVRDAVLQWQPLRAATQAHPRSGPCHQEPNLTESISSAVP